MTKQEFVKGWRLLIMQPWGWRYRSVTEAGEPTQESMDQLLFYYDKLKWAHPGAWLKVAELYAQEAEWPSVKALNTALHHENQRYVRGIEDKTRERWDEMPAEVSDMLHKIIQGKEMPA